MLCYSLLCSSAPNASTRPHVARDPSRRWSIHMAGRVHIALQFSYETCNLPIEDAPGSTIEDHDERVWGGRRGERSPTPEQPHPAPPADNRHGRARPVQCALPAGPSPSQPTQRFRCRSRAQAKGPAGGISTGTKCLPWSFLSVISL